ncbi:helix-turn-helix domain-containing protein [Paenibacillus sp. YPG26]|uniref:helix-turn-helix domain-containing protein n=1 Tax=Paenibacillus sp. YPG26 TaxID=2878915 RepID=UPI00203E1716|nr:helix-turn-helix domain-containing protein [Paenibacillus sp. YPG26]USB33976.1 helix-turn-helix domain-containing protein [Paenibacillus sp. YPG26]
MENDTLLDLVTKAQQGDRDALYQVLHRFSPLIKKHSRMAPPSDQEDLEQSIHEKLTEKILSYDLSRIPSFTDFISSLDRDAMK